MLVSSKYLSWSLQTRLLGLGCSFEKARTLSNYRSNANFGSEISLLHWVDVTLRSLSLPDGSNSF